MTSTPCPDEDTYARFLQGILPPERIADIERHIDGCPRCAELGAQFGKLYARDEADDGVDAGANRRAAPAGRPAGWLLVGELLMVGLHAVAAIAVLPWALPLAAGHAAAPATVAAAIYAAVWVPVGGVVAALAAWALWRGRRWGHAFARAHAIASIPSVVLTPLAAFVLAQTRAGTPRRQESR
jgi:hypothetical protein